MKDETVITNPGDIILVKVGKPPTGGFYARVNDIIADYKKGWWKVFLSPLVVTENFEVIKIEWKLDNDQIRGQEFTMQGIPHQLFKVEFENGDQGIYPDDPVPLPTKKKPTFTLVK